MIKNILKTTLVLIAAMSLGAQSLIAADIQCWGDNSHGELNAPSEIAMNRFEGSPVQVQGSGAFICVLNSKAKINCWGMRTDGVEFLTALTDVKNFSVGPMNLGGAISSYVCANSSSGVSCAGGTATPPDGLSAEAVLSVGDNYGCAIDKGVVRCWGKDFSIPIFKNPRKVAVGNDNICVLDDKGVTCLNDGRTDLGIQNVPPLINPTDVIISFGFACATHQKSLTCWGKPEQGSLPPIPTVPQATELTQYVTSYFQICGVNSKGVECYGTNPIIKITTPKLSHPRKLYGFSLAPQFCAEDDSGFICWGSNMAGQTSLAPVDDISAGFGNTCVASLGKLNCWGDASPAITKGNPKANGSGIAAGFYSVSLGSMFACGYNFADATLHACWGDNDLIVQKSPALSDSRFATTFITPYWTSGFAHACLVGTDFALNGGSSANCYGQNDFGQVSAPKDLSLDFQDHQLAAGGHHTCAIDLNLGVRCWGEGKFGQKLIPAGLRNPRFIVSGFQHSCVIADDGVHCWGRNLEGQTNVPQLKNPRVLAAGGYHTCAIDDDGAHCWGNNSMGQATVPKNLNSKLSAIVAGYQHTCAVTK